MADKDDLVVDADTSHCEMSLRLREMPALLADGSMAGFRQDCDAVIMVCLERGMALNKRTSQGTHWPKCH
ncbi:hypothetical protein CF70_012050 [Cupriavidus sp. SK-3]|nr:hypothetical protein CF70_012050 [Cupriavidus sp. SK-3]